MNYGILCSFRQSFICSGLLLIAIVFIGCNDNSKLLENRVAFLVEQNDVLKTELNKIVLEVENFKKSEEESRRQLNLEIDSLKSELASVKKRTEVEKPIKTENEGSNNSVRLKESSVEAVKAFSEIIAAIDTGVTYSDYLKYLTTTKAKYEFAKTGCPQLIKSELDVCLSKLVEVGDNWSTQRALQRAFGTRDPDFSKDWHEASQAYARAKSYMPN